MNTEVESYIRNNYAWLKLPQNVRQVPLVYTWAKGLSCLPRFLISGPTKSRPEPSDTARNRPAVVCAKTARSRCRFVCGLGDVYKRQGRERSGPKIW